MVEVAADFDDIAAAIATSPARGVSAAERMLLRHVPPHARRVLDVGCGDGLLSRALAARGLSVFGLDVSPGMIDLARATTPAGCRVEYECADLMRADLQDAAYDAVVSVAMVHHLPLDGIVSRLARLVAPGGVLLIQDVVGRRGMRHLPVNIAAVVTRRLRQIVARTAMSPRVAAAYARHGANEQYLDGPMVDAVYASLLPTARVYHHLEWRYSVVWERPMTTP